MCPPQPTVLTPAPSSLPPRFVPHSVVCGLTLPAFRLVQALDASDHGSSTALGALARYWVLAGLFMSLEYFLGWFLHRIPFFPLIRLALTLYALPPNSVKLFRDVIEPTIGNSSEQIDRGIAAISQASSVPLKKLPKEVRNLISSLTGVGAGHRASLPAQGRPTTAAADAEPIPAAQALSPAGGR